MRPPASWAWRSRPAGRTSAHPCRGARRGAGGGGAEAGVGAVATQSFTEEAYGPRGLSRMRGGAAASDVLAALIAEDPGRDVRQVGMVDAAGRSDAWT